MAAIREKIKSGSLASYRHSASRARLRVALSMGTEPLPCLDVSAFVADQTRWRHPHVVVAAQNVSVLQSHYSK